jgi:hypothetical protein
LATRSMSAWQLDVEDAGQDPEMGSLRFGRRRQHPSTIPAMPHENAAARAQDSS